MTKESTHLKNGILYHHRKILNKLVYRESQVFENHVRNHVTSIFGLFPRIILVTQRHTPNKRGWVNQKTFIYFYSKINKI